jgi:hypothetical protein
MARTPKRVRHHCSRTATNAGAADGANGVYSAIGSALFEADALPLLLPLWLPAPETGGGG